MFAAILLSSTPFVLIIAFLLAAACWALALLLSRDRMVGPLGSWPFRWFSLLDLLAASSFILIVFALSFLLVRVTLGPPAP